MPPHLHLLTLGVPLFVTGAGEQIKFRTRKHFALLIRLAVEAGKRFSRDYLMDLLWGDAPAQRARHSLAQALTVLKEKVGREHLLIQRTSVALAAGAVDADVARLDACDLQIRGAFLEGFEVPAARAFEHWKDEWRAKLGPRIRDCLVKQMDAGRRIGDFASVERHAQVLQDLDPLSEDGVRGVMEARAWVGDRSNALKAFSRFEADLATELGAKPSADLVRIADLLREGRRAAPRPPTAEHKPERQERRFEAETLIGREREFAKLYDAWLEVRHRTPRIMVVTGDPGVGKTTLTNAFVSTCQMEGAVVARAQAYDAERELPFAILAELIKQLTLQRAIGGADPEALSELSRVSPEIFNVFPGVPKPVEWSAEVIPLRLADCFLKAVEAATDESPLVLVVDDIHAADNASAAILHMVARKLPRTGLLLILAGRTSELRSAAAPSALVSDPTVQALQALELEPLSPQAAERVVAAVAAAGGSPATEVPSARLLQAGNGNPLALELLTKEWVAHGSSSLLSDIEALNTQPVASLGIPRAIGAVFDRQIRRLDATCRAALDLAAVLGRRLADLPLYDVVGLSAAAAGEALTRLLEEGFLREIHGGLEFRNELIRAQAYYAIAGPARQHLHRRVGELLAGRAEWKVKSEGLEIAWHMLRGGAGAGARPYALDGAEAALCTGAPFEAEQILTVVLQHQGAEPWPNSVRLLLARALMDQSKGAAASSVVQALLAEAALSPREEAEAARIEAAAQYLLANETGLLHCQAADRALETARVVDDPQLLGQALVEYAKSGIETGNEDRVLTAQAEIDGLMKRADSNHDASLHMAQGYCHYFLYNAHAANLSFKSAVQRATPSNLVQLSFAYNGCGISEHCLCNFAAAREAFLKALELANRIGDDSRASIISANMACSALFKGDYTQAINQGLRSVALGVRSPRQPYLFTAYANLAEAYLLTASPQRALEALETARGWVSRHPTWRAKIAFLLESACVALVLGNLGSALELIETAEKAARARERMVSDLGVFEKLRAFRATHLAGPDAAMALAAAACDRFRGRHPLHYLDAIAATAWIERQQHGCHSEQTERELQLFSALGAEGKRALLAAQGFLS